MSVLINSCINDQRNLIHSLKNNSHKGKTVIHFFICGEEKKKLMNKTAFSRSKKIKSKSRKFIQPLKSCSVLGFSLLRKNVMLRSLCSTKKGENV